MSLGSYSEDGRIHAQSNQTSLSLGVGRATTASNEILEALTTSTNDGTVELAGNVNRSGGLLRNLVRDGANGVLGFLDGLLGTAYGDLCVVLVRRRLVDVDLNTGRILDVVDRRASLAEDAGD